MGRRKRSTAASQPRKKIKIEPLKGKKLTSTYAHRRWPKTCVNRLQAPVERPSRPARCNYRSSRRIKGLPPLSPDVSTPFLWFISIPFSSLTGKIKQPHSGESSAPAPSSRSRPNPNRGPRTRTGEPNSPPYSSLGQKYAVDTTSAESLGDKPPPTEAYVDNATQAEYQGVAEEKGSQTGHQDVARAAFPSATAQLAYNDPVESRTMNDAQPGLTAIWDTTTTESMRSTPAHRPTVSIASQELEWKNATSSVRRSTASSTEQEAGSMNGIYKLEDFPSILEDRSLMVQLFMNRYSEDIDEESVEDTTRKLRETIKEENHDPPADARYESEVLRLTMEQLQFKNKDYVIAELGDLVCPPAKRLFAIHHGDIELHKTYKLFADHRNEAWAKARQLRDGFPNPRPDYCVGFCAKAFSPDELDLLAVVPGIPSSFVSMDDMYFPFLTCEAKSSNEPIFLAENQNAYSMMVAVSSTFKLFKAAKMEKRVHRRVLGFSISYDNRYVVVNGYYPVFAGQRLKIYRAQICHFVISPKASDKWQSWHLVRNIYEVWAPEHLEHLRMSIELLKFTTDVPGLRNGDVWKPTPSESEHIALQQLGLQESGLREAEADSAGFFNGLDRTRRAMSAPLV